MHDLYSRLRPVGRILNLKPQDWTVWDCSPIYGTDGTVHVFATRWRETADPDASWVHGSQIIHAVAAEPAGPYEIEDVVIEGDGSDGRWDSSGVINPKIYRVADTYCLLYTGCTNRQNQRQAIGLLTAPSLHGPWHKISAAAPIIMPDHNSPDFDNRLCNNPAMVRHPNGQIWIYYKAGNFASKHHQIGLAVAEALAGPYRKHAGNPVIDPAPHSVEDPYVWHDGEAFWMLASQLGFAEPGGILFRSTDGIRWDAPRPGYPSPAVFSGRQQRLEEPNLLFRNGRPTHLFNVMGACAEDPVNSGFVFEISDR